jgi:hypothetical protein
MRARSTRRKSRKTPPAAPAWQARIARVFEFPHRFSVPALLGVFVLLATFSLLQESATFDETAHLGAGISFLERSDFRLNPEPPLARMWAALPLWIGGAGADYESEGWTDADQWRFGFEFLNGPIADPRRRNPSDRLMPARLMMVLLGAAMGLVVYGWARGLFGRDAALVALFLFSLSPTILAHARYVTLDAPAALGFVLSLWLWWRCLRSPRWWSGLLMGAALACALLMKYSTLVVVPLILALGIAWAIVRRPPKRELLKMSAALAVAAVVAWAGLWAGYGFHYAAVTGPRTLNWEQTNLEEGPAAIIVDFARRHRLAPEGYVFGLAQLRGHMSRYAFLNGEIRIIGWRHYFPEAFLLKTTPALLALLGWTLWEAWKRSRWKSLDGWFLAAPVLTYSAVSIQSSMNIGHRHLLPIYPLLFIAIGHATASLLKRSRAAGVAALLLVSHAASSMLQCPRYLSYFNFIAGGADGGWRYLVDSNIDWGQDLARLKAWVESQGEPIHLAYFGTADPRAYGIDAHKVFYYYDFRRESPVIPGPGQLLAVSVTLLQGVHMETDANLGKLAMRLRLISPDVMSAWETMREQQVRRHRTHASFGDWAVAHGYLSDAKRRELEPMLISTWLAHIRDSQQPIAKAGDSIFIYRMR